MAWSSESPVAAPASNTAVSVSASSRAAAFFWLILGGGVGVLWTLRWWQMVLLRAHQSDVWWSLVLGRWQWHHHALYRLNTLGHLRAPYPDLEWGWQVLLAGLAPRAFPDLGLLVLLVASAGVLAGLVATLGRRLYGPSFVWPAFGGLAALGLASDWPLRPQILSGSFWLVLLGILDAAPRHPRRLGWLVPLAVLWSVFHGDWILVPLLAFFEAGRTFFTRSSSRLIALELSLVGLASLVAVWRFNPLHGQAIMRAVAITQAPIISQVVQEWQSPAWHTPGWLLLAGLWALIIGAVALRRLAVTPWFWWWGGTALATLWHQRMVLYNWPLTWLLVGGVLMSVLPPSVADRRRAWTWGLLAGSLWVILTQVLTSAGVARYAAAMQVPTAAVQWCARHPTAGITLTPYRLGGVWEAHGVPNVWIDGRTLFWTTHHRLQPYLAWQVGDLPASFWNRHGVTRIVWPTTATTPQTLWLDANHWHPVWHGGGLTVWQPERRALVR